MNRTKIIEDLKKEYPGKKIILDPPNNPSEIICEINPTADHPEKSIALAVVGKSKPHYHKKSTEVYEAVKGTLIVYKEGKKYILKKGEKLTIEPRIVHHAEGDETWFLTYSEPGWTYEDHILIDNSKLAVDTYDKIAGIYTKQYFDDLTDNSYIDKFLEKLPKGGKILDVGCGPGQFTKYMIDKGFQVVAIDYSNEMLTIAKQRVPAGSFKQMDMRELGFENESFDGLLVAYSLIHIPSEDIPKTMKGFHRVLKSQGYVEIIAQKGEADRIIDEPFMPSEKMFFNFFTKERLSKFLEEAELKIDYIVETESQDPDSVSDKVIYTIAQKN